MEKILRTWHLVIAILVTNVRRLFRQNRVMRYLDIKTDVDYIFIFSLQFIHYRESWECSIVIFMIMSHVM
jgi:hypothetical protein